MSLGFFLGFCFFFVLNIVVCLLILFFLSHIREDRYEISHIWLPSLLIFMG